MDSACFIHLSDLHLRSKAADLFKIDGVARLRSVFNDIKSRKIDPVFIVVTGDLTEGDCDNYRYVRSLIETLSLEDVPVFVTLGNGDSRAAFREGYLGEAPSGKPYYYQKMAGGLRIIGLDSTVPGKAGGYLDVEQLSWLKDILATPAPEGSIIFLHHPPLPTSFALMAKLLLANPGLLTQAIDGSDVLGILSGHVHFSSIGSFHGVVSATAPAVLYGLDPTVTDYFSVRDRSGYNLVMVKDQKLIVQPMLVSGAGNELYKWRG